MTVTHRIAVVTGSGRGIGAETAKQLAQHGAKVVVSDVTMALTEETVHAIQEAGGEAIGVAADVSQRSQVEALFSTAMERFGRVDILVNNAGIIRDNLVYKMTDEDFDAVLNVHLKGTFLCSQAAQKVMVPNQYGRIINFSSTSALGNRGQVNYSAAKAGIQGMTKTLSYELGRYGITCNAVAPGFIETDMTRATAARMGVDFEALKAAAAKEAAVLRVGVPADVAHAVLFFAADESSFITGQVLYVKGGA
ncbi:MAG: 3-oxoacyl-ACP reductase FabG [Acidibacillus sp.]|uniref:Short-chain reductase protein NovJ n=1 Tax=Sulfoacidibacillus ferrooxidans TaxID=2005001 RepID=A0A9X1V8Z5_9BACL|nr:3-oxoacyl-ACP reductase FabG [Sulfoacidibacillus ferrooxidans]MCI0183094.1 Short-chain reductase protein NovJ [Sulfoacidibacillus ferrooxidans]MCY0893196.1 3-oxoacyl-ACP reductase FabG [Acidibacillus sp.]